MTSTCDGDERPRDDADDATRAERVLVQPQAPRAPSDEAFLDYLRTCGPFDVQAYLCSCRACGMVGRLFAAHDCPAPRFHWLRTFRLDSTRPLGARDLDAERSMRAARDRWRRAAELEREARAADRADRHERQPGRGPRRR